MAVLTSFVIPHLTTEAYDQMSQAFTPQALSYGMLLHAAGPVDGGWQMIELWSSREALDRFFSEVVEPAMRQMGVSTPAITIAEAHNVVGLPT